jgi:DNA repair protein RecO (recombination protein O)
MANICKTEAIVLKGMRYRETSRIVSLYTRKFGKVKVVAKGVRRPKSKFGSSLEPFTVSNIVFYKRDLRDLYNISEADVVKEHAALRKDLDRMSTAYVVIDFLDAANPEEAPNVRLYALADSMLDIFEKAPAGSLDALLWTFLVRSAGMLGYGPVFDRCVKCGKMNTKMGFNPAIGGAVCSQCSLGEGDVWGIDQASLDYMERLANGGLTSSPDQDLSPKQASNISEILRAHILYHTERRMRSFDFKKSIEEASNRRKWKIENRK